MQKAHRETCLTHFWAASVRVPVAHVLLMLFCCGAVWSVFAAEGKSPTAVFLTKRGYTFPDTLITQGTPDSLNKWPDTLYYNTVYKAVLLGTPTIPISFSKIEKIEGKYQVTPSVSVGFGYTWFLGSFIFNENDKITIDPTFFFGLIGDIGLQSDFSLKELASISTGVFFGIGAFSLHVGFDYLSQSPSIGLGGRIDLYTLSQNFLKPIGKVREARKHKSVAVQIPDE